MLEKPIEEMTSREISSLFDDVETIEDLVNVTQDENVCRFADFVLPFLRDPQRMIPSYYVSHMKHCGRCAREHPDVKATYSFKPVLIVEDELPW